ncbi:tape measure protein [Ketogulonicigenium vulgare]|nr:tape measure protein [Ketogulonicigenium vulgare]
MASEDPLELPVGLSEKQFTQSIVRLEGRLAKMERDATTKFQRQNATLTRSFKDMETQIGRSLNNIKARAGSILAPLAAALGGRQLIAMTSAWTDITSRVNNAAGSMDRGTDVMERVSDMARRTYSDLRMTADSYISFASVLGDLGVATNTQLDFVESLNNALVVSGAKGDVASRVMNALSNAMALGTLQGDNLNTVIASGGRVAQALAASMGVTTLELRKMGRDGKIGRAELLGITSQMAKLRDEAAAMPATIQDGFMLLNNALLEYIGRGDDAVGISARIADALTIIADNFDTVADKGLKVAAVLAGAVLGRSVAALAVRFGTGAVEIMKYVTAMRAASSVGGLAAALGGMSAAAGPLGILLGGVVAGGLVMYSDAALKAEGRTQRVSDELERLGLVAPPAASAIDAVGSALDGLDGRLANLRDLREELEKVSTVDLQSIVDRAGSAGGLFGGWGRGGEEKDALSAVRDLAVEFGALRISADDVIRSLESIDTSSFTEDGREIISLLANHVRATSAMRDAIAQSGMSDILSDQLEAVRELDRYLKGLQYDDIASETIAQLMAVRVALQEGTMSAYEAQQALQDIGEADPNVAPFLGRIAQMTGALADLIRTADRASAAAALASDPSLAARAAAATEYGASRSEGQRIEREAADYVTEANRRNGLTREALALENEIASVRRQSLSDEVQLTEAQIRHIAAGNLAAQDARREQGRSGRRRDDTPYTDAVKSIREETQAFQIEAAAILSVADGTRDYGDALEFARKRAELLHAAQQQGRAMTPELMAEIDALAQAYVTAGLGAEEAAEKLGKIKEASDTGRATLEDFFGSIIDGSKSAREAVADLLMQIAKVQMVKGMMGLIGSTSWGGGLINAIGSGLSYDTGGYTGPGGRYQPAGIVHKGEVVWSQDDVSRVGGPAAAEMLRQTAGIPGYSEGGLVGMRLPAMSSLTTADHAGPQSMSVAITVDVSGAQGDAAIEERAAVGARAAMTQVLSDYDKRFNVKVRNAMVERRKTR